ncbi:MAG TPA: alpha/beta fold hydrolase [Candidatus Eisenbacteria bacterium]|nr:alpha/beta fold hydrolase [Candidatus Eisenbacteria bacterium]
MPISFYIKSSDALLHCAMWMPAKSRDEGIVFCHGWGGGTPYDDLLSLLADRGYTVLRFEQRGYGSSTGQADLSLWPVDMAACAAAMTGIVNKIWAMGQSTGGTMALVAATQYNCFSGAVSIAPFCSLTRILEDNPNARAILEARFGPLQEKHFAAANALEIVGALKKPVLIVQGTVDASVPHGHGMLLYQKLKSVARHRSVEGGNHHLNNVDRAPIFADIVSWLEGQQ